MKISEILLENSFWYVLYVSDKPIAKYQRKSEAIDQMNFFKKKYPLTTVELKIETPNSTPKPINEDLRKWFREKWVRFGPDGKIRGACARGSKGEGKPKCLPLSKARSLGKKGRSSAAKRKRREDPNPERRGKAKNVATKKK